jgi:hypothetical protein
MGIHMDPDPQHCLKLYTTKKTYGASGELTPMHNLTTFISPSHYVSVLPIRVTVQRTKVGLGSLKEP